MDPITQGLLGAAAGYAVAGGRLGRKAALIGGLAGMAPDLDVLIASDGSPITGWIFHRHFTHALVSVPLGAAVVAAVFCLFASFRRRWREVWLAAAAGMVTHAPLDLLTSYGTLWLWPFSMQRLALDVVSIIDPIYTGILLLGGCTALLLHSRRAVLVTLALSVAYLAFGGWQHLRAAEALQQVAQSRGHDVERSRVTPLPGSVLIWRGFYESADRFYVDGFRVPWFGATTHASGDSVARVERSRGTVSSTADLLEGPPLNVLLWFADGWVSRPTSEPDIYGDLRYGVAPESLVPLWGLRVVDGQAFYWSPAIRPDVGRLWTLITTGDAAYQPLPP